MDVSPIVMPGFHVFRGQNCSLCGLANRKQMSVMCSTKLVLLPPVSSSLMSWTPLPSPGEGTLVTEVGGAGIGVEPGGSSQFRT